MVFHSSGVLVETQNSELSLSVCNNSVVSVARNEGCHLDGRSMLYNEHEHAIAHYVIAFGHVT
jgi:hypothetical protein